MKKTVKLLILLCMTLLFATMVTAAYTGGGGSTSGGGGSAGSVPAECQHRNAEWVVDYEPGCYYYGFEELICTKCHEVLDSRDIPPTEEHIYDYEIVPPTCTEQGFTYYYCTEPYCGAYYYDDYTDIIDHNMSDWDVWFEPYCESEGHKIRWCMGCGMSEEADIPPLGHDTEHAEWVIIQYAGCYNQGEEGLMCNRCYEPTERRLTPVRGHMYDGFYYEPTCTESGYIEHRCWECGYSYQEPYGEPAGHQMSDWEVVEEPNCLSSGLMVRRCWYWDCEYYEEEIIESAGHWWGDWNITYSPECEEDGIEIRICNYCGAEDVGRVPALGHSFGEWMPWEYDEFGEVTTEMRMCDICMKEEYRTPPMAFNLIRTNRVGNSINAYVTVKNMPNGSAIWFAAYDDDGRFLGIQFAEVKNSYASAEFTEDDIAKVKAFAWGDGVSPLCNYVSTDVTQ